MRKIAAALVAAFALSFAGAAHAAAVSKALAKAANASFRGLNNRNHGAYSADRLKIHSNGKTASVELQTFGRRPGPPRQIIQPSGWYTSKTADFKKVNGQWKKQGTWQTRMFAL